MIEFLYAEINVIGIVLLLLFLNNMNRGRSRRLPVDQRIFNACLWMNVLIFVFDTGMWLADGNPQAAVRTLNLLVTMLYYVSNPLICLLWLTYTDFKIFESKQGLLGRVPFYAIPCGINAVLSVVSVFTGWLFTVDAKGTYARGPYFWVMAAAALVYLLLSFGLAVRDVVRNGWAENRTVNIHLVIFPVGILAASVVQILFFGVSLIWVCALVAFASIYINIQNGQIATDPLTGLYNRRRLDEHFQRRLKLLKPDRILFAIMIDLDDFKAINDELGHATGDDALVKTGELLRRVCKGSDDFIARMGGDEFVVLGERPLAEGVQELMDRIAAEAARCSDECGLGYRLKPSMGHSIYTKNDTANTFFATADAAMYRNKHERKQSR